MKHKDIFCNKWYAFKDKLKLFENLVTPTVLYGSSTWTLTKDMERELKVARRRMLRMMFGARRRKITTMTELAGPSGAFDTVETTEDAQLEPWTDWIKRTTYKVEELSAKMNAEDWVVSHRRKKWRFAGRTARSSDSKWSLRLLTWTPVGTRSVGRPCRRWTDGFVALAGGDWIEHAGNDQLWAALEDGFIHHELIAESL